MPGLSFRGYVWIACIVGCLVAWAGIVVAVRLHNENMREEGRAEVRAEWSHARDRAQADQDHADADRRARQQENDHATATALAAAAADAARARDAADVLRKRLAAFVAAGHQARPAQPAAGLGTGEQGTDPLDVLADLFTRADGAAGELAAYADALRTAGQRCEAGYDAEVTP